MTEGTDAYKGLAVPLFGDCEIKARTTGTDILTLTGMTGQTGDFLVCRTGTGTTSEEFSVTIDGNVASGDVNVTGATTLTGIVTYTGKPIYGTAAMLDTAPTAGMTTGGLYVWAAANVYTIGVASSATSIWEVAMTDN